MNNKLKKILAVVLAAAVFSFTVACGNVPSNKAPIDPDKPSPTEPEQPTEPGQPTEPVQPPEPEQPPEPQKPFDPSNLELDGKTLVPNITERFKYFTRGVYGEVKPSNDENYVGGLSAIMHVTPKTDQDEYIYFPYIINGMPVDECYFQCDETEGKTMYIFISSGIKMAQTFIGGTKLPYLHVVIPKTLRHLLKFSIRYEAVYFLGTPDEFNDVSFSGWGDFCGRGERYFQMECNEYKKYDDYKENPTPTPVYYYSEEEPKESGKYWRYVDGLPTVWK